MNWKRLATVAWFAFAIFWWVAMLYFARRGFDWILLVIIGILPPFYIAGIWKNIAGIWKTGAWIIKRFKEKVPPKLD